MNGQDQKREQNYKTNPLSSLITIPLYWLWSKHSLGWKNCLFGYVFLSFCCCFSFFESSRTSYFRTVFTLLLLTMFSVSHIYSWQLARLRCFSLSHAQGMFNLGQICQHWFRSKNLKASLISSTRALSSDKARCFSQSQRALYGNFIIM